MAAYPTHMGVCCTGGSEQKGSGQSPFVLAQTLHLHWANERVYSEHGKHLVTVEVHVLYCPLNILGARLIILSSKSIIRKRDVTAS